MISVNASAANTEELVLQIERAFRDVPRPQTTLRVARGMDDHQWDALERLQKLDDHYGHWDAIPREDLEKFQDVFPWLCPVGFRFYLPAFMVHALRSSPLLAENSWLRSAFRDEADLEILDGPQKVAVWHFVKAVLESVHDDYHRDWWNHPWDKEWEEDFEKEQAWQEVGKAFTFLSKHVEGATLKVTSGNDTRGGAA